MTIEPFEDNHQKWISFTADTQEDLIVLGQMSRSLPVAKHGFTITSKHSLNVLLNDVVKKIVALPEPCDH